MQKYTVTGMSCAACQANITKNVNKINGVIKTDVNLISNKMTVEFEDGADVPQVMKEVLKNCKKVEDDCEIFL